MAAGDKYTEEELQQHRIDTTPRVIETAKELINVIDSKGAVKKKHYRRNLEAAKVSLLAAIEDYERDTQPYTLMDYAMSKVVDSNMVKGMMSVLYDDSPMPGLLTLRKPEVVDDNPLD